MGCRIATFILLQALSFTATLRIVAAFGSQIQQSTDPKHAALLLARVEKAIFQTKLPVRKKLRSYPRVIKRNNSKFPTQAIVRDLTTTQGVSSDDK